MIKFDKRLLKLAAHLEQINPKGFDLSTYVTFNDFDENGNITPAYGQPVCKVLKSINKGEGNFNCGTTACAVGNLPIVFPKDFRYSGERVLSTKYVWEGGEPMSNLCAAERFLGLIGCESTYLFMPDSYPKSHRSAKYVARRIRSFVKNRNPRNLTKKYYD